jgi:hypothetical protein
LRQPIKPTFTLLLGAFCPNTSDKPPGTNDPAPKTAAPAKVFFKKLRLSTFDF